MSQYSVGLQVGITFACIGGLIFILLLLAQVLFWLARRVEKECNFGPEVTAAYAEKGWVRPTTYGPRQLRPGYWVPIDGSPEDMDESRAAGKPGVSTAPLASGSGGHRTSESEGGFSEGAPLGERVTSDTLHEGGRGETVIHMR